MINDDPLLQVKDLKVFFESPDSDGMTLILDGVNFELRKGVKKAVIGECGSGKSTLGLAIYRVLPERWLTKGEIIYAGKNLLELGNDELIALKNKDLLLIPQIPQLCLKPNIKIGYQIGAAISKHHKLSNRQVENRAVELLERTGVPNPAQFLNKLPRELSGVVAQRVIMAMGLTSGKPNLLIADEPTRGLNREALKDYLKMIDELFWGNTCLIMTHDLEVVNFCDELMVMYAGEIVESGPRSQVLKHPLHPYTKRILAAYPERGMMSIPGVLESSPTEPLTGCRFYPRCGLAADRCRNNHPEIRQISGLMVRCFYGGTG